MYLHHYPSIQLSAQLITCLIYSVVQNIRQTSRGLQSMFIIYFVLLGGMGGGFFIPSVGTPQYTTRSVYSLATGHRKTSHFLHNIGLSLSRPAISFTLSLHFFNNLSTKYIVKVFFQQTRYMVLQTNLDFLKRIRFQE